MSRIKKRYDEEYVVHPISQAGLDSWRAASDRIERTVPALFGQMVGSAGTKFPQISVDWKTARVKRSIERKKYYAPDAPTGPSLSQWLQEDDGL
jgi:hypothetical protein